MDFVSGLNENQKKAVLQTEGPVLILAGAGSGKTRVITHRIAYLINEKGVDPASILAFTFTNKAANEMKERVESLIGNVAQGMWIGTFHATCIKILRQYSELIGFDKYFAIYDRTDQLNVLKDCLKELKLNEKNFPHRMVLNEIGRAKDELITPESFETMNESDYRMSKIAELYKRYQETLTKNNAVDFDDIIMLTIKLFLENEQVLLRYNKMFKYIHVDEYQDTNTAQYYLIKLLANISGNLCVVGDDDQSIYSFRGANIRNILDFEKEYEKACVIKLERNYRSTKKILDGANYVIGNNLGRKQKKLWTQNPEGCGIVCECLETEHEEALAAVGQIRELIKSEGLKHSDFSVLYRANAQSRVIEDVFMREGIPYRIVAGLSFYQRKEIKDTISFLRLIQNQSGNIDIKRVINVPKRGIGAATVEKLEAIADEKNTSIFDIICQCDKIPELRRSSIRLLEFASMIKGFIAEKDNLKVSELVRDVINKTGMLTEFEQDNTIESKSRADNIKEFISVSMEYENNQEESASLEDFLSGISLVAGIDSLENDDSVVLMTIHSAKGLEFPVVFLVGMEERVFPGFQSAASESELEEERRLCYVGMTRAKERLYLFSSRYRTLYGKTTYNSISRFVDEIPKELIIGINKSEINKPKLKTLKKSHIIKREAGVGQDVFKSGELKAGDRVEHPKFGKGLIVSVKNAGIDVGVVFDTAGLKQLSTMYAPLKKI